MDKETPEKTAVQIASGIRGTIWQLIKESERAAVVLGVARIDSELEKLIKAVLRRNSKDPDTLFDADGPLSTFSAKIRLAYRLNLIDADFERSLTR